MAPDSRSGSEQCLVCSGTWLLCHLTATMPSPCRCLPCGSSLPLVSSPCAEGAVSVRGTCQTGTASCRAPPGARCLPPCWRAGGWHGRAPLEKRLRGRMVVKELPQLTTPSARLRLGGGRAATLPVSCLRSWQHGGSVSAGAQPDLAEVPFLWWCREVCGFLPFLLGRCYSLLLIVSLQARLRFPIDYPYSPPAFRFLTKMWHPNIYEVGLLRQHGTFWTGGGGGLCLSVTVLDENASLCLALEHGVGNSVPLAFSAWHWECS